MSIETAISMPLDWNNIDSGVSRYFTVKETIWLPSWGRQATLLDGLNTDVQANIVAHAVRMDAVRAWFGRAIHVHCWYRPPVYNSQVHGVPGSAHLEGLATDFDVAGLTCPQAVRMILEGNLLEVLELRMEDNATSQDPEPDWIHLDSREPGPGGRFFKP